MDLAAAMAQANKDAESYKDGKGETRCPKDKSGLIVVVYGDEKGEALKDVDVKAGDKKAKTGADGLAKYLPIDPGSYKVHVERPADKDLLRKPEDVTVQVRSKSCGVVPVEIPLGARPEIEVLWAHDSKGVKDVEVKLKQGGKDKHAFAKKTGDDGVTKWDDKNVEPIVPGAYDLELKIPNDEKVEVFDKGGTAVAGPIDVPKGRERLTFKLRKPAKISVEITDLPAWLKPGTATTIKYKLDGDGVCGDRTDVEVHVASRVDDRGTFESTYYAASTDRSGAPVEKPCGTESADDLTKTHLLRDHKDAVKPGDATFSWDGSCKAKAGVLKEPAKINSTCAPYTVHVRYYKDDADKGATFTLKPFYPRWSVRSGGSYALDPKSLVVQWKLDGDVKKKLKIGELRVVDKDGKLVFNAGLDAAKIESGRYDLLNDAPKQWSAASVKRAAMPYRVQLRAYSDEKEDNGLALAAMPTMVRAWDYKKVQFIAFNVGPASTYIGDADDATDIGKRCDVMTAAVKAALAKDEVKKEPDVLKVFMAPEFYFRGKAGAYPIGELSGIVPRLRTETDKIEYVDWLFLFGTAIGYEKHEEAGAEQVHGESPHRVAIVSVDSATEITAKVWTEPQPSWAFTQDAVKTAITAVAQVGEDDDSWTYKITLKSTAGLSTAKDATMIQPGAVLKHVDDANHWLQVVSSVCDRIPSTTVGGQYWKAKQGGTESKIFKAEAGAMGATWLAVESAAGFVEGAITLVEPKATEIFNVALVQKGWPAPHMGDGSLRAAVVYKERVSPIDFTRDTKLSWHEKTGKNRRILIHGDANTPVLPTEGSIDLAGSRQQRRVHGSAVGSEINKSGVGGGTVVTIDGITFGIEVCLDHAVDRLYSFYFGDSAFCEADDPIPQVLLIPSWGMTIGGGQIALPTPKGLVFNVDGARGNSVARLYDGSFGCDDHWSESSPKEGMCAKVIDYYGCDTCMTVDEKSGKCRVCLAAKTKLYKCASPRVFYECKVCGRLKDRCAHGRKCVAIHICQRCGQSWGASKTAKCDCATPAPLPCGQFCETACAVKGHTKKGCGQAYQRLGKVIDPDGSGSDVPGSDDKAYFAKKGSVLVYPPKEVASPDVV